MRILAATHFIYIFAGDSSQVGNNMLQRVIPETVTGEKVKNCFQLYCFDYSYTVKKPMRFI